MKHKRCHYCPRPPTTVDHVVPRAWGGLNRHWNRVPACFECNQAKGRAMPTCRCGHCRGALSKYVKGDRGTPSRSVRSYVRLKGGVWRVTIPQAEGKARRYKFRTRKRALEQARALCMPF